jgi:hypothetical protein
LNRKQIIILLAIATTFFFQQTNCQPFANTDLSSIADHYIKLMNQGNYKEASFLFHYPEDYTQEELVSDRTTVQKMLKIVMDTFGSIDSVYIVPPSLMVYQFSIGGGSIPYWQKHPKGFHVTHCVEFSKQGYGRFDVQFCNINSKWEIRDVSYGLPTSRSDAKPIISKLLERFMQLMPDKTTKKT